MKIDEAIRVLTQIERYPANIKGKDAACEMAIEALQEKKRNGTGWISAKYKLPEPSEFVIANVTTGLLKGIAFLLVGEDKKWHNGMYIYDGEVSHWMPLPEPPTAD